MAVTAQAGVFSWGPQTGKGVAATVFHKHRAANIDMSALSDDRLGPPEVGGIPTPTFPYRAGIMGAGGATIFPRLKDTFGWLLHGAAGAWSVQTDKDVFDATVTNFFHHTFKFAADNAFVPWMTFRKHIPGATTTSDLGETYVDSKIVSATFALPNSEPISARLDMLARTPGFDDDPSWTYDNTDFEDYQSIPLACVTGGFLKIPGFSASALPIAQGSVTIVNQPLDTRMEKVYGSPYLEDITIVGRSLSVDMIVKWTDPQLYMKILTGSTTGTEWSAASFVQDLDIYSLSGSLATGTTPWQLRIEAEAVMYQVAGPIQLAGNGAVMMRIQGQAIAPSSGDYYKIHLGNLVDGTAYTWPT